MGIIKNRWLTALVLIMVPFVVSACFQQVGDDAQGQVVSVVNSPSPEPTNTVEPSATPTTTPTAGDLPISSNPTATDTATPTETVLAVAQAGDEGQPVLATPSIDPFELTATQLVFEGTQTAVAPTTQAAATLFGQTDTPTATLDGSLFATATSPGVFVPGADCVHEVRAGENLFRLSLYYGIPVNDIVTRNGIVNMNVISIGQRLIISGCGTTGALPPATSFPTPSVTPFGSGGPNLGNPNPGSGGGVTTGIGCIAQYTVNQYDTLFQISLQYGVNVQSIANANGITNINVVDMGEVLCIPAQ